MPGLHVRPARSLPPRLAATIAALALGLSLLSVVAAPSPPVARAAEPVCTISAKLVNSCRPWLGAESGDYGVTGFRARMLEHEQRIGRQLDIVHAYLGTGNQVLSNDILTLARRPGTIALVNWKVSSRWAEGDGRNATVNGQIDRMADSIKTLGSTKIMLTVYHEPENNISPGGDPSCPNTTFVGSSGAVNNYVDMWRNVRARFDAKAVTNVVWVMNYMGWEGWNCVVRGLWPGNDYVDWVMWDPYPRNATWTTFVSSFYNYLIANNDAEHDFMSKPWGLAEFGYVGTSQSAAYRIYDDLRANLNNGVHPRLKAYVVWDNHTANSLDDRVGYTSAGVPDPVEQQHYNAFANDPLLIGTGVPEPVDETSPTVTLTAPADAASVAGTVGVAGNASDDVAVTSVALLLDGAEVSTAAPDATGAVSFDWNSVTVANGSHTLRLRARDAAGNTGLSTPVTVSVQNVDGEPPSAPAGLTATWSTPSRVSLAWSAATDNGAVTGYRVYRDNELVATLAGSARTHVDTGVANLTTHSYVVSAVDGVGNETPGAPEVVMTGDDTPPSVPTVTAELTAPGQATVTWTESVDNAAVAGYRVYRDGNLVADVTDGSFTFVDGGLDDGVTYSYRVRALDTASNLSASSSAASVATADETAPAAPEDLRASSSSQSVALTWDPATDNVGVTDYVVYRDSLPVATVGASTPRWTDTAPAGTTLHRYVVTARDAAGLESTPSNEVARTLGDSTPPAAPTLTGSRSGFTVRLTWTGATDDVGVTGYTIYRAGVAIDTTSGSAYTDTTPPLARSSSYTVRARDAAGNTSSSSNAVSVFVPDDVTAPTSPTGLVATPGTRQVTLRWNPSSDNSRVTNYYLFRGNTKYRLLGNVTSFTDTGLTSGTRYTYKVYAIDAGGNWSGPSGNVSATAR